MKILYFSRNYTPHDFRFLSALSETNHKIFYLRLESGGRTYEDRPVPAKIELITWQGGTQSLKLKDGFRLLVDLKQVFKKIKPDIVHAGPIQTSAFLTALSGFENLVSMSWGYDLLHDIDRGWHWRWASRYTLKRSAALIADCDTVKQQAVSFGMNPAKTVVFPWGISLDQFQPGQKSVFPPGSESSSSNKQFTLLSTRNWEPIYGVDLLAKAFAKIARVYPELHLIMIGQGSLAGDLQSIFNQNGVADRVYFPGHIRQVDLPQYYQSADLYISTSRTDGSSVSLLEALACGCPVIVSDIPGNREWVDPEVQGWMFKDGDVNSLAESIVHAVENRDQLPQMKLEARKLAKERADWTKNFPKLLEAYSRVIQ